MNKNRVALWDNAKWLMLVLVIMGHIIEEIRPEDPTAYWIYTFIYLFHMPVMMFIGGFFSRAEVSWKAAYSVVQLLAAYLIWELLIAGLRYLLTGWTPTQTFLTTPSWSMWFLISLASLKVLLPFIMCLKHPLTVAIIASLASGAFLEIDSTFSFSRTLGFMPFFVGGYIAKQRGLLSGDWFRAPSTRLRIAAGAALAVFAAGLWIVLRQSDSSALYRWAFFRDNYWETTLNSEIRIDLLPVEDITDSSALVILNGALVTAVFLALAFAIGFAVLLFIPRGHSVTTRMGQNTLYIYLLHIPVVRLLRHYEVVPDIYSTMGSWGLMLIGIGSVALAGLLGSTLVKRVFRPLVEPHVTAVLRPQLDGKAH